MQNHPKWVMKIRPFEVISCRKPTLRLSVLWVQFQALIGDI